MKKKPYKKNKTFHTGFVKRSILIKSTRDKVWGKISNIVGMPEWVANVEKTIFISKKRRGIGVIRKITFSDGNIVEEHIINWKSKESLSYIAVSGLPLRAYIATYTINSRKKNLIKLTWESYFNSKKMTQKEFNDFVLFLGDFYQSSLQILKSKLEK